MLAAVWRCWDSWARHHQASQLSVPSPGQGNTSWPTQSRDQGVSRDQEDTALHTEQSIRDTSIYYIDREQNRLKECIFVGKVYRNVHSLKMLFYIYFIIVYHVMSSRNTSCEWIIYNNRALQGCRITSPPRDCDVTPGS